MTKQKLAKAAWIDFLICIFFGIYGVHKFREKKIGLGILYLFTGGLFIFGWLYDCAKFLVIAIKSFSYNFRIADSDNSGATSKIKNFFVTRWKKIALIVGAVYLFLFVIVSAGFPNINTDNSNESLNGVNTTPNSTECLNEPTTAPTTAPITEPPHTHSFNEATCTKPRTCVCGATEGSAKGHSWKEATCTTPKICFICNETTGFASDHNYANGKCTDCGKADPLDPNNIKVWIPTNGGSKYHSRSSCSGMKNPKQITLAEARKSGYDACARCH